LLKANKNLKEKTEELRKREEEHSKYLQEEDEAEG